MRLITRLTSRISVALLLLLTVWAVFFYVIIIDEVNDETGDTLEDYSEQIIIRALAGEQLPSKDNGTNNSYHLERVTAGYAASVPRRRFSEEMVYIAAKGETEPARILTTIFSDRDDNYYELTVSIPTLEKADLRETILWWIIILYVALLIAIIAINALILNHSFRPLYALLGWLDDLSMDKTVAPLSNDTDITEFRRLNEAMMRSAERNAEVYRQQGEFIGNASHELQTPLAICLNRVEMLADDPSLDAAKMEQITRIHDSLEHAIRLNKTLLLITRIENEQYEASEEVSVNALIKELLGDYAEIYPERNIDVRLEEAGQADILMSPALSSALFSNLIKNAYVHNRPGGRIAITIYDDRVAIANSGSDTPLDREKIFLRFYKSAGSEGSTGLGLSVVCSICGLYGFDIDYKYVNRLHIFEVKFR